MLFPWVLENGEVSRERRGEVRDKQYIQGGGQLLALPIHCVLVFFHLVLVDHGVFQPLQEPCNVKSVRKGNEHASGLTSICLAMNGSFRASEAERRLAGSLSQILGRGMDMTWAQSTNWMLLWDWPGKDVSQLRWVVFGPIREVSLDNLVHDSHQTLTFESMRQGHKLIQDASYWPAKKETEWMLGFMGLKSWVMEAALTRRLTLSCIPHVWGLLGSCNTECQQMWKPCRRCPSGCGRYQNLQFLACCFWRRCCWRAYNIHVSDGAIYPKVSYKQLAGDEELPAFEVPVQNSPRKKIEIYWFILNDTED